MSNIQEQIQAKREEINVHYWRFTRSARGKPPPSHLYDELNELEDKLQEEKSKGVSQMDEQNAIDLQKEKGVALVTLNKEYNKELQYYSDIQKKKLAGQTLQVAYGDRDTPRTATTCAVYVFVPETNNTFKVNIPEDATFVKGKGKRNVYFPPAFHRGRTSLMARIGLGISSGKAFRGR